MDNAFKKAMGNVNNPAFLLRSNGEIVHLQTWSDAEGWETDSQRDEVIQ